MRLRTRTFLWSFVPVALLLTGSFWSVQRFVLGTVREQFRAAMRESEAAMSRQRTAAEQRNRRMLRILAEDAALKNGLQLLLTAPGDRQAKRTVEDQLGEIGIQSGFPYLAVSNGQGRVLAAVLGQPAFAPLAGGMDPPREGYFTLSGKSYRASSVAIDEAGENLGTLTVGEPFDIASLAAPAVLLRGGRVVESSLPGVSWADIESGLRTCRAAACDVPVGGNVLASSSMESAALADGYELRTFQNLDSASRPIQATLRSVFLWSGAFALTCALLLGDISSRSIVRPISALVARLRESAQTGELVEFRKSDFRGKPSPHEIRELADAFNRAAASVREGRRRLSEAVVQFIQSLANALDARDPYTAGHSRRVSQYACAIGRSLQLPPHEIDQIRMGALLHDIGKIGIADNILLKPGRLTPEESRIIQEHPSIGRKILESVQGFQPYLPIVELHHENWDGTGYPCGLRREETPLAARIVKIADAYDAMTSDRPYRRGMSHEEALAVIGKISGSQMDPGLVDVFLTMGRQQPEFAATLNPSDSLARLAEAVGAGVTPEAPTETLADKLVDKWVDKLVQKEVS